MERDEAQQELAFIKKVMEDSQRAILDNGKRYMLWSILVLAGIAAKYVLEGAGIALNAVWIWLPLIAVGWLLSFLLRRSTYAETRVKTLAQRNLEAIWAGWGIAIPILTFVGYFSGAIQSWAVSPVIATLLGSACFTTGLVTASSWLRITGILWWAGAILLFVIPTDYSVAILGGMFILLQMVPGVVLYGKYRAGTCI